MKCPHCGKEIMSSAKVCSYCGADLTSESNNIKKSRAGSATLLVGIVAVIIIVAGVAAFATGIFSTAPADVAVNDTNNTTVAPVSTDGNDSSTGDVYWASSQSGKFHKPSCEWAQKIDSSNKVVFNSHDEAVNAGYQPCKVCNP